MAETTTARDLMPLFTLLAHALGNGANAVQISDRGTAKLHDDPGWARV